MEIEEESGINIDRVKKLEYFENRNTSDNFSDNIEFSKLKEEGNVLYALRDYKSAEDYYKYSLKIMKVPFSSSMNLFSIGQEALVEQNGSIDFDFGMVSGINSDKVDILLDNGDELNDCLLTSLVLLCNNNNNKTIQRSIYMNMARCSLKRHRNGWAVKFSSIAIAISMSILSNENSNNNNNINKEEIHKQLADSFYFRGKLLISINRSKFAEKVLIIIIKISYYFYCNYYYYR